MDVARLKVDGTAKFQLRKFDPGDTHGVSKNHAAKAQPAHVEKLAALHDLLYAEHKRSLLIVLQGMDAAGKDGTIKHVMSGVNPQGCTVTSFKQPSTQELDHDFLWRIHRAVPPKGTIGIFNRSYYEDVLIARVHELAPPAVWKARYQQINDFEKMLTENNVCILKFFLHMSSGEQRKRFDERLTDPRKKWKLSSADLKEREYWDQYQSAYEDAIAKCATKEVPWYVIPSDHKWFRNFAVAEVIVCTLAAFKMRYPKAK
ncbi:MAG TPA: polyphosphate kinase 2 family protein [Bryobacteraceae bacterium]|jgi:PPK2 family polyphosphate:nucleotide phosphotransferase